ncbi:hypothetical protein OBBRIDRAFT_834819 [Obba rivulosa]|uniref:Uncharacterized protein n=1 Tax=Obba rivulosa TaxID=1052685 RepID=A0A8E2B1Z7_9APHY|nr:hypothetical protein OBBRIDRAFT_834819 [Obba rivulosa]
MHYARAHGAEILERDLFSGLTGVLGGDDNSQSKSQSSTVNPLSNPLDIPLASGDPLGIGQLTSAVGSVLNPITAPLFPTSSSSVKSSATSSSASSTLILTSSSSSSSSVSPTSSATPSSTSVSSSATPSASSTPPAPTPSNTPAPDVAAQSSDTSSASPVYATATVFAPGAAGSPSATAVATGNKSFLQNKPLSISVITIGAIIALAVLFSVATLALRKRKRDKLQFDAAAFYGEDMFKPTGSADSTDLEKSGIGARKDSWGDSNESGSSGASTQRSMSGQSRSNGGQDMYERAAYPPALGPQQTQQGYPASNYSQPRQAYPNPGPGAAGPPMPAYMVAPFEQSYRLNVNVPEASSFGNFEDNNAYDGIAYAAPVHAPVPAGRKQPPPLHVINTTPTAANLMDASPISLAASPMQPASAVNPANPPASPVTQPPLDESGQTSPVQKKRERRLTVSAIS